MVAKFLDNMELKHRRWRRQRERQKSNGFRLAKQQLCTCITLFCRFPNRRCPTSTWNFLISRAHFIEQVNTTWKFSFPVCKLRSCPFGFNTRNVANIWQIKWNGIKSMKSETVRTHFLIKVFGLLSSRNFATIARSRSHFSSLLIAWFHPLSLR